jgi:hypothetical protein
MTPIMASVMAFKFGVWASRNLDWFHPLINPTRFQESNQVNLQVTLKCIFQLMSQITADQMAH